MLPIKTIARRIRTRSHDTDDITYTDEEILDCINCGIRFIRRAIADIRPSLLMSTHEGILTAGNNQIVLDVRPTKIIHVTAGDKLIKSVTTYSSKKIYHNYEKIFNNHSPSYTKTVTNTYSEKALHRTELANIIAESSDKTGTPTDFCLIGEKTINFFPAPRYETKYSVLMIDDIEELSMSDNSPLNTEFDDFLVEYATVRLAVGNEFDMTQEQQIMSNIYSQIQRILLPPPVGCVTFPYWD